MDESQTASAKSTPFSINDILTNNNTTISRRSDVDLSPRNRGYDTMENADEPTSFVMKCNFVRPHRLRKYENHSNELHRSQSDSPQAPADGGKEFQRKRENWQKSRSERRGSLDCFLVDRNHNFSGRMNFVDPGSHRSDYQKRASRRYYDLPLVVGGPLDMRRCNNESGESERESQIETK